LSANRHLRGRALATAALSLTLLAAAVPANAAAADRLPDLAMAPLSDFRIEKSGSSKLLRYSAIIVNIGAGAFQAEGSRTSTAEPEMSVVQRIFDDSNGSRTVPTAARMYFAGDGHTHWHVRDLELSSLDRLDNGVKVGAGAKHGFCFYDNVAFSLGLAGAPGSPFFLTCGTSANALNQTMGLSVGWGDAYRYYLVDQWIDITNVDAGRYRLRTSADAQNWFAESNEANNGTWTDLQLKGNGTPRVIAQGPSA
jgi:hypothetical protein